MTLHDIVLQSTDLQETQDSNYTNELLDNIYENENFVEICCTFKQTGQLPLKILEALLVDLKSHNIFHSLDEAKELIVIELIHINQENVAKYVKSIQKIFAKFN